jgi:hypothetical protein
MERHVTSNALQKKLVAAKRKAIESLEQLERALVWLDEDPRAADRWGRLDATAKRFEGGRDA